MTSSIVLVTQGSLLVQQDTLLSFARHFAVNQRGDAAVGSKRLHQIGENLLQASKILRGSSRAEDRAAACEAAAKAARFLCYSDYDVKENAILNFASVASELARRKKLTPKDYVAIATAAWELEAIAPSQVSRRETAESPEAIEAVQKALRACQKRIGGKKYKLDFY
jgi:hypothetical protein